MKARGRGNEGERGFCWCNNKANYLHIFMYREQGLYIV